MNNMNRISGTLMLIFLLLAAGESEGQQYPVYGEEIPVAIQGLAFDAMEPFISPDGAYLFFNNLNDGIHTRLYYATRIDDSTFQLAGELSGTNQTVAPYLDAVADLDSLGNFYWTSTRNYPDETDNLHRGIFNAGTVTDIGRVRGDFNMDTPGWLVMDHGISLDGRFLYFNNARFDNINCTGPCETMLGIAGKVNDTTFNTLQGVDYLYNVNDTGYIYYAPCISADDRELYYTRYTKGDLTPATRVDICVAVRESPSDTFSVPHVLFSGALAGIIEAPTLTVDKRVLYYHKKTGGTHRIVMRYRDNSARVYAAGKNDGRFLVQVCNTGNTLIITSSRISGDRSFGVMDLSGRMVVEKTMISRRVHALDVTRFGAGVYFVVLYRDTRVDGSMKAVVQ